MSEHNSGNDDSIEKQITLTGDEVETDSGDSISSGDIRERLMEALADCDGAFVVAAKLEEDEDGDDAVGVTVARFVADELRDDEDREDELDALVASMTRASVENAVPGGEAVGLPSGNTGGLAGLFEALSRMGNAGEEEPYDDSHDNSGAGMFQ